MTQKFIDKDGLKVLWNQISLKDYPNNETLMAVIDAIDETKANKDELFSKSWNDLEDKPFYAEPAIEDIVAEQDLAFEYNSYFGAFVNMGETVDFTLIEGESYTVVFDDVEYECVAASASFAGSDGIAVGNFAFAGSSNNTGEPFIIGCTNAGGQVLATSKTDATHKVRIYREYEDIHKLDEKYLPDISAVMLVTLGNEASRARAGLPTFVADKTFEEIYAHISSGQIALLYEPFLINKYFYCDSVSEESIVFKNTFAERSESSFVVTIEFIIHNDNTVEYSEQYVGLSDYETKEDAQVKYDTIVEAKADWNQNDENSVDYIKNRPFYEETSLQHFDLTDNFTFESQTSDGITAQNGEGTFILPFSFVVGETYKFIINGTEYETTCRDMTDTFGEGYLGFGDIDAVLNNDIASVNFFAYGGYNLDIPDEFYMMVAIVTESEITEFAIDAIALNVVKIDKKYLPDIVFDKINTAQTTADNAQTTADNAQTTADNAIGKAETNASNLSTEITNREAADNLKMDKENPVGTGSFSMNRAADSIIGDYSRTNGYNTAAQGIYSSTDGLGTIASARSVCVSGEYNVEDISYSATKFTISSSTYGFEKQSTFYYSSEYNFDEKTGIYVLVSPSTVLDSELANNIKNYVDKIFIVDNSKRMFIPNAISGQSVIKIRSGAGSIYNATTYYLFRGVNVSYAEPSTDVRGKYAHIIGNGTAEDVRSNAHTLDWNGNAWFAGDVYVGGTSGTNRDEGSKKLITAEEVPQSDWNVNDKDSAAFVKNRTHWDETTMVEILPECTLTYDDKFDGFLIADEIDIAIGNTYTVKWNGASYTCVAWELDMGGVLATCIGNASCVGGSDTGEPFFLLRYPYVMQGVYAFIKPLDDSTEITISISACVGIVHKLDEKYLPDSVLAKSDWNATENELGHILNRTHYTEQVLNDYIPETTLTFESAPEGETRYSCFATGTADFEYPERFVDTFKVEFNNNTYDDLLAREYTESDGAFGDGIGNTGMFGGMGFGQYPFLIGFFNAEEAAKLGYNYIVYSRNPLTTATLRVARIENVVHQLDEKYLPETTKYQSDWNQNDENSVDYIKNRPFYEETSLQHFDLTDNFTFESQTSDGITAQNGQATLSLPFGFTVGETYKFTINGFEYEFICQDMTDFLGEGAIGFGDIDAMLNGDMTLFNFIAFGMYNTDSPNEFAMSTIIKTESEITEFAIDAVVTNLVKIDEKYLPEKTLRDYALSVNNIIPDESGNITLTKENLPPQQRIIQIVGRANANGVWDYTVGENGESFKKSDIKTLCDNGYTVIVKYYTSDTEFYEGTVVSASLNNCIVQCIDRNDDFIRLYISYTATSANISKFTAAKSNHGHSKATTSQSGFMSAEDKVALEDLKTKHTEGTESLILKSPNGTRFSITVGDDGVLTAAEITA